MTGEIKISKKTIWIALIIVALVVVFFVWDRGENSQTGNIVLSGQTGSQVGDIAPDFSITDVDGNQISLSQFKGKPVVLAFFATWCGPCQIEANRVKQVDDETGGDKFIVYQIGVDAKESLDDLREFKTDFGNNDWVVGFGLDAAQQYGVRALDTTLIVDENGNVIYRDNGVPAEVDELRRLLA